MKKAVSLILALVLCLGAAACDAKSETADTSQEGKASETAPETAAVPESENAAEAGSESVPEQTDAAEAYEPERAQTDALTWEFDAATGTLSVRGTGPMRSYSDEPPEWEQHKEEIRSVVLDEGITSVGAYAFYYYPNLAQVYLPDSVAEVDVSAFDYDRALRSITIPASLQYVGARAFYNTLLWEPEDLVFPEGCVYIGDEAFHSALKSGGIVSLPSTLAYLGQRAFTNAFLSDFTVAEGNPVYCSADHAIFTKDMKQMLMLAPDAAHGSEYCVPDGVESIAAECFNVMQGIEMVYIPASVTDIAEGAFFSTFDLREIVVDEANPCYKSEDGLLLTKDGTLLLAWPDGRDGGELVIPAGVERLGAYLFYGRFDEGCTVVLPEGVKEIGSMSLPASVSSLTLPASLEKIDDYVFYGDLAGTDIYYEGSEEDWARITVGDGNDGLSAAALHTNGQAV